MKQLISKHYMTRSLLALLLVFTLTACGSTSFDASKYVKSSLDAMTKGDFAEYMKMTQISESQAQSDYKLRIRNDVDSLTGSFMLSSDMKDKFTTIFQDIYKKCKYEVGEAVKNDDGSYSVPVTAYKMKVFANLVNETTEKATEKMKDNSTSKSSSEVRKLTAECLAEVLSEHIKNVEYGESTTVTIKVAPTSADSKIYSASETDFQKLLQAMMDVEELQVSSSDE